MAVSVTPDGSRIVSASLDRTLRVWNVGDGVCEKVLRGHTGHVAGMVLTPDGSRIVSRAAANTGDNAIRVWHLGTGTCEHTLEGHGATVNDLTFTDDGEYMLSASWDGTIRLWCIETGQCEHIFDEPSHDGGFDPVVVTQDGRYMISTSRDDISVWNLPQRSFECMMRGHFGSIHCVSLTPDCRHVVTASVDGVLAVWDLERGCCEWQSAVHESFILAMALSPDGRYAVTSSSDKTLRVTSLIDRKCVQSVTVEVEARTIVTRQSEKPSDCYGR